MLFFCIGDDPSMPEGNKFIFLFHFPVEWIAPSAVRALPSALQDRGVVCIFSLETISSFWRLLMCFSSYLVFS